MRINFDIEDLEAFLAVRKTGSFHMAAASLSLSQSAITRRIQKLEAALDSVLFERTTRKVKPTLAAKRLHARAESILEDAQETVRAMRDESVAFAYQRSLVVTVAVIPTVIAEVLSPAMAAFRSKGHRARVRLLDLAANEVSDAVAEGEADFGLSSMPTPDNDLSFEPLFDDPMVLVLPSDHGLAQDLELKSWSQLQNERLILPARGTGNRVLIDDALARSRDAVSWTYETGRSTTALALVRDGLGLAILPHSAVKNEDEERISWMPLPGPQLSRPVGILDRIGQSGSKEAVSLRTALRAVGASLAKRLVSP